MAWQNHDWTEPEIDATFAEHGACNVGLVLGKRSGIVAVECDAPEAERTFADLFAGCEPVVTPTFQSRRGKYRLFASQPRLAALDSAVISIGKLQILVGGGGKGQQCLLPPSTTDNVQRFWRIDLEDCNLARLPKRTLNRIVKSAPNFSDSDSDSQSNLVSVSDSTQASQSAGLHDWYKSRNTEGTDTSECVPARSGSLTIGEAIRRTLPTGQGQRHRQIFELCRYLRAMPEFANAADLESMRPIVKQWHQQALPLIRTKKFDLTWIDFVDSFPKVKFPAGGEPISMIYKQSLLLPLPTAAGRYEDDSLRRLVGLCAELQRRAGSAEFYLACRVAGEKLGIDHKLANKWLRLLVRDGVLVEVEKGTRRRASTFRYLADVAAVESTAA